MDLAGAHDLGDHTVGPKALGQCGSLLTLSSSVQPIAGVLLSIARGFLAGPRGCRGAALAGYCSLYPQRAELSTTVSGLQAAGCDSHFNLVVNSDLPSVHLNFPLSPPISFCK